MDITRENFSQMLPDIKKAMEEASFIAIDGEFTGLTNGSFNVTSYDSPEERYMKIHSNTHNFLLIQFGMCTFCWNEETQKYKSSAFNFYIFPFKSTVAGIPDRVFSCQSSSLDFLTKQGFDFNKVFKNGIPFLRPNEEATVRVALEEKQAFRECSLKSPGKRKSNSGLQSPVSNGSPPLFTDQKAKDFLDQIINKVRQYLEDDKQEKELVLDSCNSYFRKILYETLPVTFADQILVESRTDENTNQRHVVVVRGGSEALKKARQEQTKSRENSDVEDAVGFSNQCRKLVVGHNMLLDIIYTIQQFVHPLPNELDEFKSLVTCTFPQVLDTKLMGSMMPFRDILSSTALGEMNTRLKANPFRPVELEVPGKYNIGSLKEQNINLHEAAYDAFVTGSSFLSMVHFLASFQKPLRNVTSFSALCNLVSPYINKIFLMRSHDIPYLNLAGADLTPNREHIFHIEFPPSWRSNDIRQLFSPLGQINISWIDETHCLVGLYNKQQAKNVKNLVKSTNIEPTLYKIVTYKEYQTELSPQNHMKTNSKNLVWQSSKPNRNSLMLNYPQVLKASSSFTSSLQATKITCDKNTSNTIPRKRPEPFGENSDKSRIFCCADADQDEPLLKRQKSQEDCETAVMQKDDNSSEISSKADGKSNLFTVPTDWE